MYIFRRDLWNRHTMVWHTIPTTAPSGVCQVYDVKSFSKD